MQFSDADLLNIVAQYGLSSMRILGLLLVLPLLARIEWWQKIAFAAVLSVAVTPWVPVTLLGKGLSMIDWLVTMAQEALVGVVLALLLQLCWESVVLAGQLLAQLTGSSYAQVLDPISYEEIPALSVFLQVIATLSFCALGGHVLFVQWLVSSYQSIPVASAIDGKNLAAIAAAVGQLFAAGLWLALPAVTALLCLHIAAGVMVRVAPAMGMMVIVFPITMVFGLLVIMLTLDGIQQQFIQQLLGLNSAIPKLLAP